jgi:hypothetical protein
MLELPSQGTVVIWVQAPPYNEVDALDEVDADGCRRIRRSRCKGLRGRLYPDNYPPRGVEVVRLYESYLSNFRFTGSEP